MSAATSSFCSIEATRSVSTPLSLDEILVHPRLLTMHFVRFSPNSLPVPIFSPGWREVLSDLTVVSLKEQHKSS